LGRVKRPRTPRTPGAINRAVSREKHSNTRRLEGEIMLTIEGKAFWTGPMHFNNAAYYRMLPYHKTELEGKVREPGEAGHHDGSCCEINF